METGSKIDSFLSKYEPSVVTNATALRKMLVNSLPGIQEQLDLSARLVAYAYGKKYSELICVIVPSKKGLKLGFNRGVDLPDPDKILRGTGKISRYVEIQSADQVRSGSLQGLLSAAIDLYHTRISSANKNAK